MSENSKQKVVITGAEMCQCLIVMSNFQLLGPTEWEIHDGLLGQPVDFQVSNHHISTVATSYRNKKLIITYGRKRRCLNLHTEANILHMHADRKTVKKTDSV